MAHIAQGGSAEEKASAFVAGTAERLKRHHGLILPRSSGLQASVSRAAVAEEEGADTLHRLRATTK
jgi:hypothetical protein